MARLTRIALSVSILIGLAHESTVNAQFRIRVESSNQTGPPSFNDWRKSILERDVAGFTELGSGQLSKSDRHLRRLQETNGLSHDPNVSAYVAGSHTGLIPLSPTMPGKISPPYVEYSTNWKWKPAKKQAWNDAVSIKPFVRRQEGNIPTTGHETRYGPVVGKNNKQSRRLLAPLRDGNVFNFKYGFINPYYPLPWDTPLIRPNANDNHEGWVSKYLYTRPTVSPYMGLFRHDITPYGATKYDTFVRERVNSFYGIRRWPKSSVSKPMAQHSIADASSSQSAASPKLLLAPKTDVSSTRFGEW